MISGWVTKLLASILVFCSVIAIIGFVTSQTILNSKYLKQQFTEANGYNRLSTALSAEIAQEAGADNPQVAATAQKILTPQVLRQRTDQALDQYQANLKGNGQVPTIDLSDLAAQAQAAGVQIPADSALNQPIKLAPANAAGSKPAQQVDRTKIALVVAVVLLLVLAFTSWKSKRYTTIPNALISTGVIIGLIALGILGSQKAIEHFVKFDFTSNAFASIGNDVVTSIAKDIGHRYGMIAIILLAVGIVTRIIAGRFKPAPVQPRPAPAVAAPVRR
jgi:hypothetical protein